MDKLSSPFKKKDKEKSEEKEAKEVKDPESTDEKKKAHKNVFSGMTHAASHLNPFSHDKDGHKEKDKEGHKEKDKESKSSQNSLMRSTSSEKEKEKEGDEAEHTRKKKEKKEKKEKGNSLRRKSSKVEEKSAAKSEDDVSPTTSATDGVESENSAEEGAAHSEEEIPKGTQPKPTTTVPSVVAESADDAPGTQPTIVANEPPTPMPEPENEVSLEGPAEAVLESQGATQTQLNKLKNLKPQVVIDQKNFIGYLKDYVLSIGSVSVGIVSAWILGYFGFNILWSVGIAVAVYKSQLHAAERVWERRFEALEKERRIRDIEAIPFGDAGAKESMGWANDLLRKFWPRAGPVISSIVLEKATEAIEKQFAKSKPPGVTDLRVEAFHLGQTPPDIRFMRVYPKVDSNIYKLDIGFHYAGEILVEVNLKMGAGKFGVPLPIIVHDIILSGEANLEIELAHAMPFVATVAVIVTKLKVDLSLKTLKADVLDLPIVHSWMCKTISYLLTSKPIIIKLMDEEEVLAALSSAEKMERKQRQFFGAAFGSGLSNAVGSFGNSTVSVVKGVGDVSLKGVKGIGTGVTTVGSAGIKGATAIGDMGAKGSMAAVRGVGSGVTTIGSGMAHGATAIGSGTTSAVKGMGNMVGAPFKRKKKDKSPEDEAE